MLEKPDLHEQKLVACLQNEFGVNATQLTFLPLGADQNTAVYRVVGDDGTPYFLKLRSGSFDETSVALPRFLCKQGIEQIIAPLTIETGQLWATLGAFRMILYPFVEGRNGYEVVMSARHWREFGSALKRIHTVELPPALMSCIRRETYSPRWREMVKIFLTQVDDDVFDDPVAQKVAALLRVEHAQILDLVNQAERLAQRLQTQAADFVLCHSDLHAGNILIDAEGAFYIVDWDDPILAPKERDLMFAGGAQGFLGHTPQEEETLFYQGYGQTNIDSAALAYYRYERIVVDIGEFCRQLLLTNEGGQDREQSLHYLKSSFMPGGTIEIAYESDKTQREA